MTRRPILVNAPDACYHLHRCGARGVNPAMIWQWARRGHIKSYRGGRTRYDLREIVEHARKRGLLDSS